MSCDCSDTNVLMWPDGSKHEPSDADSIAMSYGLCLCFDEFIENKCIWIIDLSNDIKIFQDDDRPKLHTCSAWKRLGYYMEDYGDTVSIAKMRLRFGTHIIELPPERHYYFYSRGILQSASQTYGLDFHIVGWPTEDKQESLVCTWFKTPELVMTSQKPRAISDCQTEQLIGIDNRR